MDISGHPAIGPGTVTNTTGYLVSGLNHLWKVTCGLHVTGASWVDIMDSTTDTGDETLVIMGVSTTAMAMGAQASMVEDGTVIALNTTPLL